MLSTMQSYANSIWETISDIKNKLVEAYKGIYDTLTSPFKGLASLVRRGVDDKSALTRFRQQAFAQINEKLNDPDQANVDYSELTRDFTNKTKSWIKQIIDEEIKRLGKPPVKFVIAPAGSMARDETGPVTDFEIAILMEKETPEARQYFMKLSQQIADRMFILGEHPDIGGKGMRLDEADNAPPHDKFFARNATHEQKRQMMREAVENREWDKIPYEGSRPYLASIEDFANFSKGLYPNEGLSRNQRQNKRDDLFKKTLASALRKNPARKGSDKYKEIVAQTHYFVDEVMRPYSSREKRIAFSAGRRLGRNIVPLYGDENLFKRFLQKREANLSKTHPETGLTEREQIAYECMQEDISDTLMKQKDLLLEGKLGKKIDLKRELYRFVEQFVTNMGFFHNCEKQNCADIVKELHQRNLVPDSTKDLLLDFINFSTKMRLKQQMVLERQGFATYIDAEAFSEDKEELETKIKGLEDSIEYMRSTGDDARADQLERDLFKTKVKYDHLLDMAPGKILSHEDTALIKDKYVPMLKTLFDIAKGWTNNVHQYAEQKKLVQQANQAERSPSQNNRQQTNQQKSQPRRGQRHHKQQQRAQQTAQQKPAITRAYDLAKGKSKNTKATSKNAQQRNRRYQPRLTPNRRRQQAVSAA